MVVAVFRLWFSCFGEEDDGLVAEYGKSCSTTGEGDVSAETEGSSRLSRRVKAGISYLFPTEEKTPVGRGSVSGVALASFELLGWACGFGAQAILGLNFVRHQRAKCP